MVLRRFAAVPGSTILEAPQGTGRRSGSFPFLSLLKRKEKHQLILLVDTKAGKDRQNSLMFFIPPPNCFCLSVEAQLNASHHSRLSSWVPTWHETQTHPRVCWSHPGPEGVELLGLAVTCHRPQPLCFWPHQRTVPKREHHDTHQCWTPAHTPACRPELCSKYQHLFLKVLVMKEASQMLQACTAKLWQTVSNFMSIHDRAILQWEQSSESTAIHITSQNRESGQNLHYFMCKRQQWQKNIFPVSAMCLANAMLTPTDATFSKLLLFMLREQGPTNDGETARASCCHFGHTASAGAQHQLQSAVTLLWATTAHLKRRLR